jgi:hypothetical protein
MRLILCSLLVLAWTSGPLFGPKAPTLSAPLTSAPAVEPAAPPVDFDNLNSQARDALDRLRLSQAARGMAVASASGF